MKLIAFILAFMIILTGCTAATTPTTTTPTVTTTESPATTTSTSAPTVTITKPGSTATLPSLGGVVLGDLADAVIEALGQDHQEKTELDYADMIGEDLLIWEYKSGLTVAIGKKSRKVQRLSTVNSDILTDMGVQVGDNAMTAMDIYKAKYQPATSRDNNKELIGWFRIGEEAVIVLDFDRDDNQLTDPALALNPNTQVEAIVISYWKYFD